MNAPSAASYATTMTNAAPTLYLVPRAIDRLAEGRRLAAPLLGGTDANERLALLGAHPDVIELTPLEKKQRIGIDQVREMVRIAQFSPVQADRKVCLIPRAETLTLEAANALLKILEEPPRDLAFVILTEHSSDLLPTIVSRCRLIRIPPLARAAVARRLTEAGYSKEEAAWLGRLALRDGDLERLAGERISVTAAREGASTELRSGPIPNLIEAALGDDPIRRYEALLLLVARIGDQDSELLTVGVRTLASQDRDPLARFLQELLSASFDLLRSSFDPAEDRPLIREIRDPIGPPRLQVLCRAIGDAHQSIALYGPPEAVLLSLMLTPGGDGNGE